MLFCCEDCSRLLSASLYFICRYRKFTRDIRSKRLFLGRPLLFIELLSSIIFNALKKFYNLINFSMIFYLSTIFRLSFYLFPHPSYPFYLLTLFFLTLSHQRFVPILARPMAMAGAHDVTWTDVAFDYAHSVGARAHLSS